MKKIICMLLSALTVLSFSGCAEKKPDPPAESTSAEIPYDSVTLTDFENVLFHGRVLTDREGAHIDWTYSGFTIRGWFDGKIVINISDAVSSNGLDAFLLHVTVDGGADEIVSCKKTDRRIVVADVEKGYHTVTVRKTTEGVSCKFILRSIVFNGVPDTKAEKKDLRIEVIGDSITCGGGAAPDEETLKEYNYLDHYDSWNSYASMAARDLDAEINFVSVSGWGLVHGSTSADQKIPSIYGYTSYVTSTDAEWDFSSYVPDVVVIALGANDMNASVDEKNRYDMYVKEFLTTVRSKYPDAQIIWMEGMMTELLNDMIEAGVEDMNDPKISVLKCFTDKGGGWGHPSYYAQTEYSKLLSARITELLK